MSVYDHSFRSAFTLLQQDRLSDAAAELTRCLSAIGMIRAQLSDNRPARFATYNNWRTWLSDLIIYTQGAQRSCGDGNAPTAREQMRLIREHFYTMHRQTNAMLSSDWIYAFRIALSAAEPDVKLLQKLRDNLNAARPTAQAQREVEAYAKARNEFVATIDAALAKGTLSPDDIKTMRSATFGLLTLYGLGLN